MTSRHHRRGPRGDIRPEDLLEAAQRVLGTGGAAALTLRAVASEAGVTPNAIYTYFEDMAALRNRIGDDFVGRFDLGLLRQACPAHALRQFLAHVLGVAEGAPGQVAILAAQRIAGPRTLALNEALLDFFVDAVGHPSARAASLTMLVTEWLHGRLLLSGSNAAPPGFTAALERLDLDRYPRTAIMLRAGDDDSSLDVLVAAITEPPA
ncbi:TetR/AcrR family transcriptional regulator [Occultella glacieicola]|uniref:TetR/AcrR family transcriptional regulator n=1 Tax=Occultella glacieicola TaxID=2518684 RepID=A0ABY2E000_9MICO|nr:TetR/AcrR family transcriptional regulator [Occultella glacieicola]TDE89663.1 TetR/AcrR family transcriptional regulator [Occultella glacieicola]